MSPFAVRPRLRLDIGFRDLVVGLAACAARGSHSRHEQALLDTWAPEEEALACFSVRSAFDLLLSGLGLPPGSEVAFTAITHPDMVRIAHAHRLRVVPIDLDLATLAPTPQSLARIGPATRLVVVAHLFGGRVDLGPISERARQHGALVVEDCAQALRGPNDHGDPRADVSLFSFGAIKTATALGGALACVRDGPLLEEMRQAQARLPRQRRRNYLAKLVKFSGLVVLSQSVVYGVFLRAIGLFGSDIDDFVHGLVKAFPPPAQGSGDENQEKAFLRRIRQAPSVPLLVLLRRRLRRFDAQRLAGRRAIGERVSGQLGNGLVHPGSAAMDRTHWVFPLIAPDPAAVIAELRSVGLDAGSTTSGVAVVGAPDDAPELDPFSARAIVARLVFVPVYPELGQAGIRRLLVALQRVTTASGLKAARSDRSVITDDTAW